MQNTKPTQKVAFLLFALAAITFALLLFTPSQAYAKSYSMPKVDIQAEVTTDGTLNVNEQRTFSFDGSFTAVWWVIPNLSYDADLQINGMSIMRVDGSGQPLGDPVQLSEEPFNTAWRDAGGPGHDSYSVDSVQNTVYAFFDASDENLLITFNYAISSEIDVYKDVVDVYWQYVGEHWEVDSENVSMTLHIPVPEGTEVVVGENIRAWGHGPLDGNVTINGDGTVTYLVPRVSPGQFAEARVVFPSEWLTDFTATTSTQKSNLTINKLQSILDEEQIWADEANRTRMLSLALVIGCVVVSVLLLLWAIRSYFKYGKEYDPDFTDQYWRDVPSPQDHPAVIARLWRWNKESNEDFTATLMHLSHIGAIQINKGSYEKPGRFGSSKTVDDYYITLSPTVPAFTSPVDSAAIHFLFNKIAKGANSLWFGSIQKYGEDNPEDFINEMKSWQGVLSAETNKRNFFEFKSQMKQGIMIGVGILYLLLGIFITFILENFIPLFFIVPVAIVLIVISTFMSRRSREGNNIDAKSKALKNWLRDFSALDERPPTDVKVWGQFMVYAFIFGIAKQVIKELQMKVPELFQENGSMMSTGYVPWWFWYSASYGAGGNVIPSASDMFQSSVANTMQTAQAAISAASGDFSSGGGFGGGFSGGGGGGFGGGGGGAR